MHIKDRLKSQSKDITGSMSHFDAANKLLNRSEFNLLSLKDRNDLVFVDS